MPEPASVIILSGGLIGVLLKYARSKFAEAKRVFDIIFSSIAIFFLSPLFLLLAFGVKVTSRGPVFYTQDRVGKEGQLFKIYKYRTMVDEGENKTGVVWAQQSDPRLTRFGKFLRDHHLDELPQFVNVFRGDMSIIGPRPERPYFVDQFNEAIPGYHKRLQIKPGITGLAQTRQKYDVTLDDVRKKLAMDLMYIKQMCWMVDVRIFLQTFRVLFTGKVGLPKKTVTKTTLLPH